VRSAARPCPSDRNAMPTSARRATALLAALAFTAPAHATDCPGRADLATGVVLERSAPASRATFRIAGAGIDEHRQALIAGLPGPTVRNRYAHGLAIAGQHRAQGSTTFSYSADLAPLDRLDEIGSFSTGVSVALDGAEISTGNLHLEFRGRGEIVLGECSYAVWQVHRALLLCDAAPSLSDLLYAPALGLVLREVRRGDDGAAIDTIAYTAIHLAGDE
jgi:hypothetical protein